MLLMSQRHQLWLRQAVAAQTQNQDSHQTWLQSLAFKAFHTVQWNYFLLFKHLSDKRIGFCSCYLVSWWKAWPRLHLFIVRHFLTRINFNLLFRFTTCWPNNECRFLLLAIRSYIWLGRHVIFGISNFYWLLLCSGSFAHGFASSRSPRL